MEFRSEERYACAALFTLALHQSQADAGIPGEGETAEATWGQPQGNEDIGDASNSLGECEADVLAAKWSAFWGWDCCGPGGILEQLYTALEVPKRSWPGLKRLPEVGGTSVAHRSRYLQLVSSYIAVLDKDLPSIHLILKERKTQHIDPATKSTGVSEALARRASGTSDDTPRAAIRESPDFLDGVTSGSDSDLEQDLANVHLQRRLLQRSTSNSRPPPSKPSENLQHAAVSTEESQDPLAISSSKALETLGAELCGGVGIEESHAGPSEAVREFREAKSFSRAEALSQALKQWHRDTEEGKHIGGSSAPAAKEEQPDCEISPVEGSASPRVTELLKPAASTGSLKEQLISAKALAAIWVLLEACILRRAGEIPQLGSRKAEIQDTEVEAHDDGRELPEYKSGSLEDVNTIGGVPPQVRWYDSRSRASLRLVASWLRVPWQHVVNFEGLLVHQLLVPAAGEAKAASSPWEHSLRAAKIGAATLGIGALFAVTGGIAAPAIAGGIGAAIGLAGGSAAVATGISGFLATTAGGAVIASTVGAAGVGLSAPHIAHRIGVVKEFGFWSLDAERLLPFSTESSSSSAQPATSSSKNTESVERISEPSFSSNGDIAGGLPSSDNSDDRMAGSFLLASNSASGGGVKNAAEGQPGAAKPLGGLAGKVLNSTERQEVELVEAPQSASNAMQHVNVHIEMTELQEPPDMGRDKLETTGTAVAHHRASCSELLGDAAPDTGHITPNSGCYGPRLPRVQGRKTGCQRVTQSTSKAVGDGPSSAKHQASQSLKPEGARWRWSKEGYREPIMLPTPVAMGRKIEDMRMSLTIGVCGWISQRQDFEMQWLDLARRQKSSEVFTLVWESKELMELSTAIIDFAASQAGQEAAKWVLQHFFFTGLVAALMWPALIYTAVQLIDTAWSVALQRAQKAGRLLAHVLASGMHGDRPVILVGNSMGARLIFHCLLELSRLKAKGIVEHACLLGMPAALRPERWAMARSVVAGRLINGFSRKDWLLAVVYRGANGFIKDAAGLCPAPFPGVENVNLTGLVEGHFDYIDKSAEVLDLINLYD